MPSESPQPKPDTEPVVRRRITLGRTRRRLSFERRLRFWFAAASLPFLVTLGWACRLRGLSLRDVAMAEAGCLLLWALASSYLFDEITRPLQTLSNILAALREQDYAFRARGARRGDSMGDLALEVNALASALQQQRGSALDALALAERVMTTMQSPVLAFDERHGLRLLNAAAERAFGVQRATSMGRDAGALGLNALLEVKDESLFEQRGAREDVVARWSVRRAAFRLYGTPHTLFVLSDVAAALQEEERTAWHRLIRVLGHEINNSLTPIKSIASMLRSRPLHLAADMHTSQDLDELRRGLMLIEDRADSLNRFLAAYQELARLPRPTMRPVALRTLVGRTVPLERRLRVEVAPSPEVELRADPDQLQQLLINLLKNAADAALDKDLGNAQPEVTVQWSVATQGVLLTVTDNGPVWRVPPTCLCRSTRPSRTARALA